MNPNFTAIVKSYVALKITVDFVNASKFCTSYVARFWVYVCYIFMYIPHWKDLQENILIIKTGIKSLRLLFCLHRKPL